MDLVQDQASSENLKELRKADLGAQKQRYLENEESLHTCIHKSYEGMDSR